MIKKLKFTALLISLAASLAYAQGKKTLQREDDDQAAVNLFVGRYGETFEYDLGWSVRAEMDGPVEIVMLARKGTTYKRSDYRPENFTPLHLIQLMVIPKDAPGGFKSLKEFRQAREADLKVSGCEYVFVNMEKFPLDSFLVVIRKPYQLNQLYSQSKTHFFVLTAADTRAEGLRTVVRSLRRYLIRVSPYPLQGESIADLSLLWKQRQPLLRVALVLGIALLLMGIRGKHWALRKLNALGWGLLCFSIGGLFLGALFGWSYSFIVAYLYQQEILHSETWRQGTYPAILLILLMPWVCRWLSDFLGGTKPRRVFGWAWLISLPLAGYATVSLVQQGWDPPREILVDLAFYLAYGMVLLGAALAVCFALAFRVKPDDEAN